MLSINLRFIELCFAPAQVAHVTGEVQFPKTKDGQVGMGWAAGQVATTADFSHGSWFWTHFSGGLNYQVSLDSLTSLSHLVLLVTILSECCHVK